MCQNASVASILNINMRQLQGFRSPCSPHHWRIDDNCRPLNKTLESVREWWTWTSKTMQLSRFHAQNQCHARVLAHRLSPLPHGCHTCVWRLWKERRQLHTFIQNLAIRVGVVKVDVPECERGIDFKHRNATVAQFSMSTFTTPARIPF